MKWNIQFNKRTYGNGGFIADKNDYTRQKPTTISDTDWYTFTVKNADNATVDIEIKTGGACPTTPSDIRSTFSFIK